MNRIEKILFSKIETWVVILSVPVLLILLIVFGAMVRNVAHKEDTFGFAGQVAYRLASIPADLKAYLEYENPHSISADMSLQRDRSMAENAHARFAGRAGFDFSYAPDSQAVSDYLLLSRYDGETELNVVELVDLDTQEIVYSWPLDDSEFRVEATDNPFIKFPGVDGEFLLVRHPFAEANGDLVFHASYSPMYSIDMCGDLEWQNTDFAFHHSLERDENGDYWVPGVRRTSLETFDETFKDDHIVKISDTGEVLYSKSVTEILIENDLINRMYVYDRYVTDPIHLNDVEPVLSDSDFWKKGDVFLSLAHLNMVLLFRPETGEVLWWSQDAIMHQHDIDIVGPGAVSVYNNNRTTRASGDLVLGLNELVLYRLEDDTHTTHFQEAFSRLQIKTVNQGLHDFSSDGGVMVEETNYGRVIMFDQSGDLLWEYVNRASDGRIYTMNWVRLMPRSAGDSVRDAVSDGTCS